MNNTNNNIKPSIILEGAIFDVPEKYKKYTDGKIVAECYLQTADERNQNKRIYPKSVLDQGMKAIQPKIESRRFIGELDHPISDNQTRQCTVEYKSASHLVREWWWEGNRIKGVVETLSFCENGRIMSGLIANGIPVGFSLRGLADVYSQNGAQMVQAPLIVISYDCVSEPSHKGSQVTELRQEGKTIQLTEQTGLKILTEARNFYTLSNNRTYTGNALDYLVENKIIKLMKKFTMI
jgi:hypothetical protein